nr:hypothetical protein [uncultured Fluviicola sp.]
MRKIGILLLFFQLATCSISYAQDQTTEYDWQKVEVRIIESRKTSKKLKLFGESMIKTPSPIKALSDFNEDQLMEMKKKAAKDNAGFVYVDLKGIYSSPDFLALANKEKIYYYWANEK